MTSGGGVYVVPLEEPQMRSVVISCKEHRVTTRYENVHAGQMVPICCSQATMKEEVSAIKAGNG